MNKQVVSIVAAFGLAVLGFALWTFSRQDEPRSTVEQGPANAPTEEPSTAQATLEPPVDAVVEQRVAETAPTATSTSAERVTVIGRLVDEHDQPLAGIELRLSGYRAWSDVADVPQLEAKYDVRGWQLESNADGAFRFEAPVPTVALTFLQIRPGRYLEKRTTYFGGSHDSGGGQLTAGVRDLGSIRLLETGAIAGTVRNADGEPLANVKFHVGDESWQTRGFRGTSDATGAFLVPHVEAGSHGLEAELEGYLDLFRKPIAVVAGQTTEGVNFVLQSAPTLSGRVEFTDGSPAPGMHVTASPTASGSSGRTLSLEDGSFTLYLPKSEPFYCRATLASSSVPDFTSRVTYEPSTTDIVLVVEPDVMTRFVLLDAGTKLPVERFGLRVLRRRGTLPAKAYSFRGGSPRLETHTDGVLETGARPEIDYYDIVAPNYKRTSGPVAHDDASGTQTIYLDAGPVLRGRVTHDGQPIAGLTVNLSQAKLSRVGGSWIGDSSLSYPGFSAMDAKPSVPSILVDPENKQRTETDENGAFMFRGLDPSKEHMLLVDGNARGVFQRWGLKVANSPVNLGDVELRPWARIQGQVLLPPGIPPGPVRISVDDWRSKSKIATNAAGHFEIEQLPAGPDTLTTLEKPGQLSSGRARLVELKSGETKTVTLDLQHCGSTPVTVHITGLAEADLPKWSVAFERPPGLALMPYSTSSFNLGSFSAQGIATGFIRSIGPARATLKSPDGSRSVAAHASVELAAGIPVRLDISVGLGALQLSFPTSLKWPEKGLLHLFVGASEHYFQVENHLLTDHTSNYLTEAGVLTFPSLPVGSIRVKAEIFDDATKPQLFSFTPAAPQPTLYSTTQSFEIVLGQTTPATLP